MFFFFKQKTAYEMRISDWSSDVCSSDLRCADRDEHCIGAGDRIGQFGGEGQPACRHVGCDKIVEARLIDRDLAGIQRLNLRTVLVDAYDFMAEIGKAGSGYKPHIA